MKQEEPIILDFTKINEGLAEEGAKLKGALMQLLGLDDYFKLFPTPSMIRGTSSQVSSFYNATVNEKKYMNAVEKYGLNNPATFSSKDKLLRSIRDFEKETGMRWPLQ